jgi:hypothetical protein
MEGFLGFRAGRWDAAVLAAFGKAARRAPRPRGRGGARHRTQLGHAKRGNPVTVRQERPPAGGQQRGIRGGTGRLRKRTAAAGRQQESGCIYGWTLQARPCPYNWPHTGLRARARKGADVSRVAL